MKKTATTSYTGGGCFLFQFITSLIIFAFDFIKDKSLPDNRPILLTKIIMHAKRKTDNNKRVGNIKRSNLIFPDNLITAFMKFDN